MGNLLNLHLDLRLLWVLLLLLLLLPVLLQFLLWQMQAEDGWRECKHFMHHFKNLLAQIQPFDAFNRSDDLEVQAHTEQPQASDSNSVISRPKFSHHFLPYLKQNTAGTQFTVICEREEIQVSSRLKNYWIKIILGWAAGSRTFRASAAIFTAQPKFSIGKCSNPAGLDQLWCHQLNGC